MKKKIHFFNYLKIDIFSLTFMVWKTESFVNLNFSISSEKFFLLFCSKVWLNTELVKYCVLKTLPLFEYKLSYKLSAKAD
jgi:hypothetical protein